MAQRYVPGHHSRCASIGALVPYGASAAPTATTVFSHLTSVSFPL